MSRLIEELESVFRGEIFEDEATLKAYSEDASIFEVKPKAVAFPKDPEDVKALVRFVKDRKKTDPELALTARAGGTCMSGGPLTESIVVAFKKYFTAIGKVENSTITVQPGVFYRDFERETLKHNLIFPSFPASREICAMGGIVNNNAGGEKSVAYGKTENYVTGLKVVLSDGNEYKIAPLDEKGLGEKLGLENFEGEIYRKIHKLIMGNYEALVRAKPNVAKNSAGYFLWNVWDKEKRIFDLTKLFVGAQGTLGLVTEAEFRLVPVKKYSQMVVAFLYDLAPLAKAVDAILPLSPEGFESYDKHTLKLAVRYFPSFAKLLGTRNLFSLFSQFLPEILMVLTGGVPSLVLQAEFTSDDEAELKGRVAEANQRLHALNLKTRVVNTEIGIRKYHLIRRESFNLLRQKIKGRHAAAFIDDFVVRPERLGSFLPELDKILNKFKLTYTVAGHIGEGNFHIIPLMNLSDVRDRAVIPELTDLVYDLVLRYGGSITGEHNDGLIRSHYLKKMYGEGIYRLFEEVKKIFDPENIFNPGKKVGSDWKFSLAHIKRS